MDKKLIYKLFLEKLDSTEILCDEPMKNHTSFKIGGPADFFIIPNTKEHLTDVLEICKSNKIPYYIIGNGSNLLVKDEGYRGVIIQIYKNLNNVIITDNKIYAEAGILLSTLANRLCDANYSGFEFASGIPGTLGGAIYMNAGAYGGEMKQVLGNVDAIDEKGNIITIPKDSLELGYRTSILQTKKYIALGATLNLEKGDKKDIKALMEELKVKRTTKQPLEMPSAGSTFKRPEGYYAGKLIMDAGLRGFTIGGAMVSEKHCGFVVNKGNATYEDVINLIKYIQNTVKEKFNVELEPEVRII